MTHAELVSLAVRWLWKRRRCHVVLSEKGGIEVPDAIGWETWKNSILVECKTSRSDFRRDAKKPSRRFPKTGLGRERYYLAPAGMLSPNELPEGWGLLEPTGRGGLRVVRRSEVHERYEDDESRMLFWELSMFLRGFRRGPGVDPKYGRPVVSSCGKEDGWENSEHSSAGLPPGS